VTSSWVVRQPALRKAFDIICWVSLGQTPNIDDAQESLFTQLSPSMPWDSDASPDKKKLCLQNAFAMRNVLVVFDDLWEASHEAALNMIDLDTRSKVLVSSRVRAIAAGTDAAHSGMAASSTVIDIDLPSQEDAVQMLFSTAGVTCQKAPPEAFEMVEFCALLPLAIAIAGKLVRDVTDGDGSSADWNGILGLMKEEFAGITHQHAVEEAVISSSLKALKGTQTKKITCLFFSLGLIPEDVVCPLAILRMMYSACCSDRDGADSTQPPSIVSIRRWLKCLIDRSLVLGTVDRPSLHDLVRDYCLSQFSSAELQAANARIVDCLRDQRPILVRGTPGEWNLSLSNDPASRYVKYNCCHHVRQAGWTAESNTRWLLDLPQDTITIATGKYVGAAKLAALIAEAESTNDRLSTIKLSMLAGKVMFASGEDPAQTAYYFNKAQEALIAMSSVAVAADLRTQLDDLEIHALGVLFSLNYYSLDWEGRPRYIDTRPDYLATTAAGQRRCGDVAFLYYFQSNGYLFHACMISSSPDIVPFQRMFSKFPIHLANGARTLPNRRDRENCCITLCSVAIYTTMLTVEQWPTEWDDIWGQNGEFLRIGSECYDWELHHDSNRSQQAGMDCNLMGCVVPEVLSYHYGDVEASRAYFQSTVGFLERSANEPDMGSSVHGVSLVTVFNGWGKFSLVTSEQEDRDAMANVLLLAKCNWAEADNTVDQVIKNWPFVTVRGACTGEREGEPGFMSAELLAWANKLLWVLTASDPGVSAAEVMASLPSIEEMVVYNRGMFKTSIGSCCGVFTCVPTWIALVCEKFEAYEAALPWADAASSGDVTRLGTLNVVDTITSCRAKGRCLARLGRTVAAAQAFDASIAMSVENGLHLLELLAMAELHSFVRRYTDADTDTAAANAGGGGAMMRRMKTVISKMFGQSPQRDRVESALGKLQLPDGVTLAAIMA
jgi:hypothetical protein